MKSMTGFAQGRFQFDQFSLYISFKSLNHRFLDMNIKGTGVSAGTESLLREIVQEKLSRGKVEIILDIFDTNPEKFQIQFNQELLGKVIQRIQSFQNQYGSSSHFSLDPFIKIPMIFRIEYLFNNFSRKDLTAIRKSVESVFNDFLKSREVEGNSILADILKAIKKIDQKLKLVRDKGQLIEKEIFAKYKEKISRFLKDSDIDERRILQEAAIAAEKLCINEEIHRLGTHNQRLEKLLLNKKILSKGKEADFLAQEMLRETHTIAAKLDSMSVLQFVIEMRREVEKIKQQLQNIE